VDTLADHGSGSAPLRDAAGSIKTARSLERAVKRVNTGGVTGALSGIGVNPESELELRAIPSQLLWAVIGVK